MRDAINRWFPLLALAAALIVLVGVVWNPPWLDSWIENRSTQLQIGALLVLILATTAYAVHTDALAQQAKTQAAASWQLATESERARTAQQLPVVDLQLVSQEHDRDHPAFPRELGLSIRNIGVGAALNCRLRAEHQDCEYQTVELGTLAKGESITRQQLMKVRFQNQPAGPQDRGLEVIASYQDVFGRSFESRSQLAKAQGGMWAQERWDFIERSE